MMTFVKLMSPHWLWVSVLWLCGCVHYLKKISVMSECQCGGGQGNFLPSSVQLPPNLWVSAVAPRTIQLGVIWAGGVEIVLPIIDRFYSDGSIGFYVRGFEKSFYLSFRIMGCVTDVMHHMHNTWLSDSLPSPIPFLLSTSKRLRILQRLHVLSELHVPLAYAYISPLHKPPPVLV